MNLNIKSKWFLCVVGCVIFALLVIICFILFGSRGNIANASSIDTTIVNNWVVNPSLNKEEVIKSGGMFILESHYENGNGEYVLVVDSIPYKYKYRLALQGYTGNGDEVGIYIVLSNRDDLSYEEVVNKIGQNSDMKSCFDITDARIVGIGLVKK